MKLKKLPLLGFAVLAAPCQAQQATDDTALETITTGDSIRDTAITVVASGAREFLYGTGLQVSVIGEDEIARVQGPDIVRMLERIPGVTTSRNGSLGSFTGVRVRGAEAEQLLVLFDGARLADPGSPGAGFDFGTLLPYGIGKIELLRGSNSTIWGSQALGGVLAVTGSQHAGVAGSAEYGSHDSVSAAVSAGTGWWGATMAALDAAYVDTDGISSAAAGSEPDGFRQWQVGGRAAQSVTDWLVLEASGRLADGRLEIDGFPAPAFMLADTPEYQRTRQASGRAGARFSWSRLRLDGAYSVADTEREQFDPATGSQPTYATDGSSERAELRGEWAPEGAFAVRFGGEREWTRFESTFDGRKQASVSGIYAQVGYAGETVAAHAGLRRDDHSRFGGEWSAGADARVQLSYDWSVHASYGEGFKAPSLFQLFSDFGNAALQPERSRSVDLGIGTGDRNLYGAYFDLTLFRRDTRGLIGFVSCFGLTGGICSGRPFGTYANIGQARAQGIEVEGGFRFDDHLAVQAAYSYLEAQDRTPGAATEGNALARRPQHALTGSLDWQPIEAVRLGADLRVVSDSFDDAANLVPLGGYASLALRGEWDASAQITLFGRVENLWDEDYQTAAGYATEGRAVHLGARARW